MVEKTSVLGAAKPSQLAGRGADPKSAGLATGPSPILSPLTDPVMTGRINEDIMELFVHAAKLLAIMNKHLADRLNFIIEVWRALGVEEIGHMLPHITDLYKTHTRLKVIETSHAFLA